MDGIKKFSREKLFRKEPVKDQQKENNYVKLCWLVKWQDGGGAQILQDCPDPSK